MVALAEALIAVEAAVLLGGFLVASISDVRTREVDDRLWQLLGAIGLGIGTVLVLPGGALATAVWWLVGLLALQHLFAWDLRLGGFGERYADVLELSFYVGVLVAVALAAVRFGIGASAVPYPALALLVTVLFARGLFELGVLYGGADAKALMVAGLLVPVWVAPLFVPGSTAAAFAAVVPFPINLLMDGALASLAVPIALAGRNLARRQFSFARGFTGYALPVAELPDRFVWVRDPAVPEARREEAEVETTAEDRALRVRIAARLRADGVPAVWVTPQIPFLVLLTAGTALALVAGNLVIDLLAIL
ncbi:MAG TPA: A24 family peptidase C-terminal domain-containing protein [Thermoplasmata archaeon]|nr:A24 family peptidase C-terminal domain-containing protein [Thermoplasmata archaeon]